MLVTIYTLGCKVNTYESNVMMEQFQKLGYQYVKENADVAIINTCSVTNTASRKSVKMIHQAIRKNPNAVIVVCGCMSQVATEEIKNIEGVHIVLGNWGKSQIPSFVEAYFRTKQQIVAVKELEEVPFECMQLENFNRTRAFIKIQDGCENFCSYCIIPYARGHVRSKSKKEIIQEANSLIQHGHHEIVLTGIHTGHYGSDLKDYHFSDLLYDLLKLDGLERLRISSIEMNEITDEVIALMKEYPVLVDHMHIPLQSGCDKILTLMNRKYQLKDFEQKLRDIRAARPEISITTDVIVGFPTETEKDFEETIDTVKRFAFSKIHVFPYSRRKGTVADEMDGQIDERIKKERTKRLIAVSEELENNYRKQFLGRQVTVIPETYKDGMLIGHTGNYLLVKVPGSEALLHQTITVQLTEINGIYMMGKLLSPLHEDSCLC